MKTVMIGAPTCPGDIAGALVLISTHGLSLDAAGAEIYHKEQGSVEVQIQSADLTDRLNVINLPSLPSGTAVAPQRSISARLKITF